MPRRRAWVKPLAFFFSSRTRHTCCLSDWSSDVCSSDLARACDSSYVSNRMREQGILLGTDGPYHNVVKIRPPMPFDGGDADLLVEALERAIGEISS